MTAKYFLGLFVLIASGIGFAAYGQIFLKESAVLFGCVGLAYVFMRGLLGVCYEAASWAVKVLDS